MLTVPNLLMAWQNSYKIHHKLHFEVTIFKKENIKADIGLQPRERWDASMQKAAVNFVRGQYTCKKSRNTKQETVKIAKFLSVKSAIFDFDEVNENLFSLV